MARIRSIHPGQWTDEGFVSCSMEARLLALALRNVADDQGVFEWKVLTLKMQLFPADAVDVASLLDELAESDQIKKFVVAGRQFGAIRNFRRWQRPEKPKPVHPLPEPMMAYVGLAAPDRQASEERSPQGMGPDENLSSSCRGDDPCGSTISHRHSGGASASASGPVADRSPTHPRPVGDASSNVSAEEGGRRDTSSLRSDGAPAAPPPPAGQPPDQRTELWRVGLPSLVRMTGKPKDRCRAILGRLLADAGDDCELLCRKLVEAEERRVVDPVAWLEAAVRTATGARIPAHRPGQGSGFGQFVRGMRSAQAAHAGPMFDGVADEVPAA